MFFDGSVCFASRLSILCLLSFFRSGLYSCVRDLCFDSSCSWFILVFLFSSVLLFFLLVFLFFTRVMTFSLTADLPAFFLPHQFLVALISNYFAVFLSYRSRMLFLLSFLPTEFIFLCLPPLFSRSSARGCFLLDRVASCSRGESLPL